jgi:hypothetical protein
MEGRTLQSILEEDEADDKPNDSDWDQPGVTLSED